MRLKELRKKTKEELIAEIVSLQEQCDYWHMLGKLGEI